MCASEFTLLDVLAAGAQRAADPLSGSWRVTREAEAVFTLIYTSGSTGSPKGAVFTHGLFRELLRETLDTKTRQVMLSKDPLAHISDREDVLSTLVCGGSVYNVPFRQIRRPARHE